MTSQSRVTLLGLPAFVAATETRVSETICGAGLPDDLVKLLLTGGWIRRTRGPLAHPLAPFYFTLRGSGAHVESHAIRIGAAYILMYRAQSVLDDVQDGDLEGALARAGDAVATHCGTALLYLGVDAFWRVATQLGGARGETLRRTLTENMMRAGAGQHRDLVGRGRGETPAHVLTNGIDKSAVFSLLFQLAGLCTLEEGATSIPRGFSDIGDAVAAIRQAINDVDDLFSGDSEDLRTGAWNLLLAVFLEDFPAEQRTTQREALSNADAAEVRGVLYDSGAVESVAELVEAARLRVHAGFARLGFRGPYVALALAWVDALVARYYYPPALVDAVDIDAATPDGLPPDDAALLARLQSQRTWVVGA